MAQICGHEPWQTGCQVPVSLALVAQYIKSLRGESAQAKVMSDPRSRSLFALPDHADRAPGIGHRR
jgi:hypothetical protein